MLSLNTIALFTLFASLATAALTSHHKVRHKHNLLSLRNNHINEIRDAFDAYQNAVGKARTKNNLEEFPLVKHVTLSDVYVDETDNNLKLAPKDEHKNFIKNSERQINEQKSNSAQSKTHHIQSSEYFSRHKRVHVTTSTTPRTTTTSKFDNYDDEYDDDDNDTTNRRLNDDAQAGSPRSGRDVS